MAGVPRFPEATPESAAPITLHHHVPPDQMPPLPPLVSENLARLRQHVDDLHAIVPDFHAVGDAGESRLAARQRLDRLIGHPSSAARGFNLPETDPQVMRQAEEVERLTIAATSLRNLYQTRTEAWNAGSVILQNCLAELRNLPGNVALIDWDGSPPKVQKGASVTDAIEDVRRHGRELKAQLLRVQQAPLPAHLVKRQVREEIEALAKAPNISMHGRPTQFPMLNLKVAILNSEQPLAGFVEVPDTVGLLVWTLKDALLAKLDAEIEASARAESSPSAALEPAEREVHEAELMAAILDNDRDEAALVWRQFPHGATFRPDCAPAAVLRYELVTVPTKGSSPEHRAVEVVGSRR